MVQMTPPLTPSTLPRAGSLDRSLATPLHAQLTAMLRESIRSGALSAGARLPSTRTYADELGLSRGVVETAYRQLAAEGFLESRARTRSVVRSGLDVRHVTPAPPPPRPALDLSATTPDLALFPREAWLRHTRAVLRTLPDTRLDYGEPAGPVEFRARLAERLARVRGVSATAHTVVATTGFTHGLSLVARALARNDVSRVAVEDPGFDEARATLVACGLEPVGIAVDDGGMVVAQLEQSGAEAVLITPAHQFPTGSVLGSTRRREIVEWARSTGAYILEDDYDAEFRYDRSPLGALQGLAPDRVVLLGSTAKTLAPGLRIGWVVGPPAIVAGVLAERAVTDVLTPVLPLLAFAEMLESGGFDRHLRRARRIYGRRRELLLAELAGHAVRGTAAGMHLVIDLEPRREPEVSDALATRGVHVRTLSSYAVSQPPSQYGVVVGFGRLGESDLLVAAEHLRAALGTPAPRRAPGPRDGRPRERATRGSLRA